MMLEADNYAGWERARFRSRRSFRAGSGHTIRHLDEATYRRARDAQQHRPFHIGTRGDTRWWWYRGRHYREARGLLADDVQALVDSCHSAPASTRLLNHAGDSGN